LDEPLSNLDAHLRAEMRGEIRSLQQRLSITTLFVTHDQEEALAMSDRVGVMSHGRLVEVGTPLALCDRPQAAFTASFLGARTVVPGRSESGLFVAPGLRCTGAPKGANAIVLRAARLRLAGHGADDDAGPLSVSGVLTGCAYLGDAFEIDIETAAGRVRVLSPSEIPPPPVGSVCAISALPGGCSFLT
ncbi:MAG: sfuC, partial [Devosia sp.]|uniref:TOBE domain-containing protein n=1 Tax=Devosia sp. TaxID=1871048 RepID=UPI0026306C4A